MLPPKYASTNAPTANNPATIMETISDVAVPDSGKSHSKVSRLILPPSKGQIGKRELTQMNSNKRTHTGSDSSVSVAKQMNNTPSTIPKITNWADGPAK